eukprot:GGOE01028801.1.p1 GENE.GGOE01028801.1~~GGOE01028801.1.p1  ORF type:complete len:501 (-),score=138.65 GGOE01028801.1:1446-2948(-)
MARQELFLLAALLVCTALCSVYLLRLKGLDAGESKCGLLLERLVSAVGQPKGCNCKLYADQVAQYERLVAQLQDELAQLRKGGSTPAPAPKQAVERAAVCPSPPSCSVCTACPACPAAATAASPLPCPCPLCPAATGGSCKEHRDRATFLDGKVNQVFQLLKTYIGRYQDLLQQNEDDAIDRLEASARAAHVSPVPYYRPRTKSLKLAILTPQEGPGNPMTRMSAFTKERYCAIHGYDFILDTSAYAANHTRHATWNRVPSLQKHLPKYDWILYMDSDISITNASILLEDFVLRFPNDTRIAFTDGQENFNAGAFFIKNDPWSYWLLDTWWNASESDPGKYCGSKDDFKFHRCKFQWNDQVGLWDAMLPYYAEKSGTGKKVTCKTTPSTDWLASQACYRDTMIQLGHPYGKRSAYHFYFWPLEADPRGWTFFQLDRRGLSVWPESELFHPMDFALHTHDDKAVLRYSIYRQMQGREERRRRRATAIPLETGNSTLVLSQP